MSSGCANFEMREFLSGPTKHASQGLTVNKFYESDGTYIYASFDIPQKSQAHVNTLFCWLQWMVMEIIVHLITMREDHQASNS